MSYHANDDNSIGSDILAREQSCNEDGTVLPEAQNQVLERTSEYFPPELLNRLDTMLVFNKLSRQSILQVVDLRLADVASRLHGRRITLDVDDTARNWLAKKGYSDVYGARAIARVVRTDVLFPLAQRLLRGTIRSVLSGVMVISSAHSVTTGMETLSLFEWILKRMHWTSRKITPLMLQLRQRT
jgi:ATP-dependent Clp protease ATP-binding subunit ClpA